MVSQFKAKYTSRGKFGGHHISLYVEKNDKKIIESLLYPKQSTVKGQSFFLLSILSGEAISSYPP